MKPLRRTSMIWVIAAFAVALLPQLPRMPAAVAALTLFPLAWRVGAELRGWKPLPAMVRHGLTAAALAALFFSYGDLTGRRAAVSLLAVMLALKLIECYRIRDARLVVSFSLFLCATQFLFAQGILMPVYGLACILVALAALARLQRDAAWDELGRPPPRIRAPVAAEIGFALRLLGLALPAGLALFLLFPRLATPLWGIPESTLDSRSGLSDSMSPGSIQSLFMDDSPAFRVTFDGARPEYRQLYWRGPVFWRYDGRTWEQSFYSRNLLAPDLPAADGAALSYNVQMEPNERKWLFALDYPAAVPADTRVTVDFQLLRREPVTQLLQYDVVSRPEFVDSPQLPDELRRQALELPDDYNPRTRELVERWRSETPDDVALIRRVLEHFNREPFRYTLNPPLLGSHPVDDFLFDTRAGFCEFYASSFAVMMRMAGIPARVVTGYQGGWYNDRGDYLLVRQSDAHAWVEVWLPGQGWVREDPTSWVSPQRIERGAFGAVDAPRHLLDFPWLRHLKNDVDIVQQRWNDWVIEYGAERQARLFEPLGIERLSAGRLTLLMLVAVGLAGLVVFPLVLRVRGPAEKDPVRRAWLRFLKRLERAGYPARASLGAMELSDAAAAALPGQASAIRHIGRLYTRCRFAPDPPDPAVLRQAVRAFRPKRNRP
jgi:transglutaminase-like putative cysteine protease